MAFCCFPSLLSAGHVLTHQCHFWPAAALLDVSQGHDTPCCGLHTGGLFSRVRAQVQVDARQVERKAQAAQQSMARRAQRLEKAQAAATQAHLAAVERQGSLQKEQHIPPARATLQQVQCSQVCRLRCHAHTCNASSGSGNSEEWLLIRLFNSQVEVKCDAVSW